VLSAYNNSIYGLVIVLLFLALLSAGFVFEIGKGALKINSIQSHNLNNIYLSPAPSGSGSAFSVKTGFKDGFAEKQIKLKSTEELFNK
jgi:hypothetical protein